jgi:molecular chaperone GrpE
MKKNDKKSDTHGTHKKTDAEQPSEKKPLDKRPPADPLEELRNQLEQATDQTLRSRAELDNYRKRVAREMDEQRRYANLSLMRDLLPVLDNVQRAIEAAGSSVAGNTQESAGLVEGFKMVAELLRGVLKQHNCVEIPALDEPFDPHLHEAVLQQPSDDHAPGTVTKVLQSGFQLHDRVVRPSQVIVSASPPPRHDNPENDNPEDADDAHV